ncbi:uncharacterized protein LOC111385161 [Olea europaea var. sylvestris]|uniref:uncharacterized protein LOC111385161 n=1 Tax=Olea europaea var. sylvestris TaxID=158386 RepID=UPI000C1CE689|nr:uncharacterized protein LOC111385161 [Olea europaea var. sylvestris]
MGIRKKLQAVLGKGFRTSKFRFKINLAIARLSVLKNQRRARYSIARSDVVELLKLGNHESALLRVELVIMEQNMLDVFAIIEGYCHLLIERANLIEQEKVCPDELKEAVSSLVYAATRCGELPELQEIRAIFTAQFGKEFAANAAELRNGCIVNPKIVQKLLTRVPSLEEKLKVLKEIGSEYNIDIQIEKAASVVPVVNLESGTKNQQESSRITTSGVSNPEENRRMWPEDIETVEIFSDSVKMRRRYTDVADAAQAAYESASYAAAAARAAVELSRSESTDPDGPNSPNVQERIEPTNSKIFTREKAVARFMDAKVDPIFKKTHPIQNYSFSSGIEKKTGHYKNGTEFKISLSGSSSDSADDYEETKMFVGEEGRLGKEKVLDGTDDETAYISRTPRSETYFMDTSIKDDILEGRSTKPYCSSHKNFLLRSQTVLTMESGPDNSKKHFAEEIRTQGAQHLNVHKRPISVRTRQA